MRAFYIDLGEAKPLPNGGIARIGILFKITSAPCSIERIRMSIWEGKRENRKRKIEPIVLSMEATFADLVEAIQNREKIRTHEFFEDLFIEQLEDKFSAQIMLVARVEDLLDRSDQVGNIEVLELFREYGYEQEDVEAFLPLKFE